MTLTLNQFNNLLAFVCITGNSEYVISLDPEYLIEKFSQYIGNPDLIHNNEDHSKGIHQILRTRIIDEYHKKWKVDLNVIKRKEKINNILNDTEE